MPENTTEAVHYHLSANVKFDKENAFNGGETKIDGSWVNSNLEKDYFVEEKIKVNINYSNSNKKNYINKNDNEETIEKLLGYDYIKINEKNIKQLIKFEDKSKNTNILISDFEDKIENETYDFYLQSIDNKKNIDKTYSGDTSNVFNIENQYYHGGSKSGYDARKIVENKSFTLFYTKDNIADINNENSILIGLGQIQNKIGVLDTNDEKRKGKIYCYNHYDKNEKYYLFRFPYQELIAIKESKESAKESKESAKRFLEELVEPLSIENSDKPFFKEKSYVIPAAIVLKYANRLYEQIMKLKQNKTLWEAVKNASNGKNWHFCDDSSIRFLKDSVEKKLREAQLTQKNPGLWALKDYLHISNNASETEIQLQDQYENFIGMCSGKSVGNFSLDNLFECSNTDLKGYIINNLTNYPINNPETIKRIFLHLGIKIEIKTRENNNYFLYDVSQFKIENKSLCNLIDDVKNNRSLYNNQKSTYYRDIVHKSNAINKYLQKSTIFSINKDFINQENIPDNICGKLCLHTSNLIDINEILKNPYLLFEKYIQNDDAPLLLDDIDWGQKIILKEEIEEDKKFKKDNPFRLRAIVVEYIKKQENQSGHVWVSYEDAQEYLNDRLYELDNKLEKFYKISDFWDIEIFEYDNNKKFLTLKEFANRETYIKKAISGLINSSHLNSNKVLAELKKAEQDNPDNKFIESEKSLIKMKELDFVFISGVAGSGKSHTLCKYLDYLAEKNFTDFQVLTPSGKAANVIKKKIEDNEKSFSNIWNYLFEIKDNKISNKKDKKIERISKISTADRYIVDSNNFWNHRLFARVDDDSTPNDEINVLIIDEISMITLDTLYYILKIKQPKKLIILGDIKQLPPIGYGSLATSIYNHLFLESSFQDICLAKMETSHRADDNSLFIKHSLTLRDKEKQLKEEDLLRYSNSLSTDKDKNFILLSYSDKYPTLKNFTLENPNKLKDFTLKNLPLEKQIISIYKIEGTKPTFLENIKNMNKEIQILTPNRIGESGTYAINKVFKDALGDTKEGLKFIYNKNDKNTGLSNGTMGYYEIEEEEKKEIINFDGVTVPYTENSENTNYELGFAITVHKSQGSGFPIVILVLPKQNNSLIMKELIYTALTRPEQKMYILYHKDNIKALTQLPSIPHRNMNLFDRDKLLWIKDEIEYPIKYNDIVYRRKQDLYFALMLEYSDVEDVEYHKNGSFVWSEKLLMPKFYIEEKQDEKSFKYLKSIDLRKVYENFGFKLDNIEYDQLPKRDNENKDDIISDNKDSIEITTHNGLRTRSWSEAILMLIFDNLKIPYFYEVEIRKEDNANTYKLTYPNPEDKNYRIPDFTISAEPIEFTNTTSPIEITGVKCIIEHLGMLTNDSYKKGWKEKVKDYNKKYDFKVIAPLRSLTKNAEDKYFISEIWEIDQNEITQLRKEISIKDNICFTTDEKDLEDILTLIKKLELLKEFYFPKQESK